MCMFRLRVPGLVRQDSSVGYVLDQDHARLDQDAG